MEFKLDFSDWRCVSEQQVNRIETVHQITGLWESLQHEKGWSSENSVVRRGAKPITPALWEAEAGGSQA